MVPGSIPTENLPQKTHDAPKQERRILERKQLELPKTPPLPLDITTFIRQLQRKEIDPWQIGKSSNDEVRLEYYDEVHSIPKYTVIVNSALEFSLFVFNWLVPEQNFVYVENKRSVIHLDIVGLLKYIESSKLCEGLEEDADVKSVSVDPTEKPDPAVQTSIVRHSVPKVINPEEPHFQVSIIYRSVGCDTLTSSEHLNSLCKPCESVLKKMKRVAKRKDRGSASPAKTKAPLSKCGPKKLQSTVVSTRLQVKDLEDRLQKLQKEIQQHDVGVSETLEKGILTIMGGQNLDATPHMKFFWQEQIKLLQSSKMGRRYHPQVIRFAPIHTQQISICLQGTTRQWRPCSS